MAAKKSNASFIGRGEAGAYGRKYRKDHPLLQGRVPASVYAEAKRRAQAVDFSLSKWLGYWLEMTFKEHRAVR